VVASFPIVSDGLLSLAEAGDSTGNEIAETLVPVVKLLLPLATFAAACLMISKIRYPHFFNQLFSGRASRKHVILMLVTLVLLFFMHQALLFVAFTYFAFLAPLRSLWVSRVLPLFGNKTGDESDEAE
jgi:CDP-diacylglycerol--serine O-phosphatidyltransferase